MKEHDIVVLTKPIKGDEGQPLPAGAIGTIVHVHRGQNSFEVEFAINGVATVDVSKLRPEFTCVYCGCTDGRACSGGCTWVETHQHTPTGVCSNCVASIKGLQRLDIGGFILIKPGVRGDGKVWMQFAGEGGDMSEAKLADHLVKFFTKNF